MKRSFATKILAGAVVVAMALSIASCGKKEEEKKAKETEATQATEETTTVPTTEATTIPVYSGPMTNDITVSWNEQPLDQPLTKYIKCTDYINVRKGPGTDYEIVAKFANNMQIVVTAVTDNNWFKTNDGFYVSAELCNDAPSA